MGSQSNHPLDSNGQGSVGQGRLRNRAFKSTNSLEAAIVIVHQPPGLALRVDWQVALPSVKGSRSRLRRVTTLSFARAVLDGRRGSDEPLRLATTHVSKHSLVDSTSLRTPKCDYCRYRLSRSCVLESAVIERRSDLPSQTSSVRYTTRQAWVIDNDIGSRKWSDHPPVERVCVHSFFFDIDPSSLCIVSSTIRLSVPLLRSCSTSVVAVVMVRAKAKNCQFAPVAS